MRNVLVASTALVILAYSSVASAQPMQGDVKPAQGASTSRSGPMGLPQSGMPDRRLADRLAFLKEALRLNSDQEKNWPAYEGALQALFNVHRERMAAGPEQYRTTDPTRRLRQRAEVLARVEHGFSPPRRCSGAALQRPR
jgi:hypothetical protein